MLNAIKSYIEGAMGMHRRNFSFLLGVEGGCTEKGHLKQRCKGPIRANKAKCAYAEGRAEGSSVPGG